MRRITTAKLQEVLEKHRKWLITEEGGERADLSNADLRNADLSNVDLCYAVLCYADLKNTDFSRADLSRANLSGANLSGVIGNMKELKSMQIEVYTIAYTDTVMQIGCENHLINDWFKFDDGRILEMDGKRGLDFWKKWKPILKMII